MCGQVVVCWVGLSGSWGQEDARLKGVCPVGGDLMGWRMRQEFGKEMEGGWRVGMRLAVGGRVCGKWRVGVRMALADGRCASELWGHVGCRWEEDVSREVDVLVGSVDAAHTGRCLSGCW